MRPSWTPSRLAGWGAAALCLIASLPAGCDRNDPARQAGPATQPATQPAAPAGQNVPDGSSVAAAPGAAPASPGTPASPGAPPAAPGAAAPAPASGDPRTRPAQPQAGRPGETFVVEPNPDLKGRFGRLLIQFPEGSNAQCGISLYKSGEQESVQSTYNKLSADLLPGTYDVAVSDVRINGVEIRPRHNTRVRVGVLKITAESGTSLKVRAADGTRAFSGYGSKSVGLPVGKYTLEVAGQGEEVTIKDGEVTDF